MVKVIDFKTKEQMFEQWYNKVFDTNMKGKETPSAMIIWEGKDEKGDPVVMHARYNVDLTNLRWFHRAISETVLDKTFDNWMRTHIKEYLEHINT